MSSLQVVQSAGLAVFRQVKDEETSELKVEWLMVQDWTPHWTPPKGRLDPGENAMEAALRETKEESGLEPATMLTIYEDISTQISYVRKIRPKALLSEIVKLDELSNTTKHFPFQVLLVLKFYIISYLTTLASRW